jgi:superfamily I DNA/RNA helicase
VREAGEKIRLVALEDGDAEAGYVAKEVKRVLDEKTATPDDVALLYRANPQSRVFEEELRLLGVPYRVVGGQEFFERKDVKNVLAYLTLIARPNDEIAFRRVVNLPARGLGDKAVGAFVDAAKIAERRCSRPRSPTNGSAPFSAASARRSSGCARCSPRNRTEPCATT